MYKHLLFSLLLVFLSGCQFLEPPPQPDPPASTDIQKLSKYINLPSKPVKVIWRTRRITTPGFAPGPTDWELVAVITYDKQTVDNLLKKTPKLSEFNQPSLEKDLLFQWFPQELKDSPNSSDQANYLEINQTAYDPNIFTKSPLLNGYFVRVGKTSDLFLYLQTH